MRTTEDAVRSLKRYLALALGGPAPLAAAKLYASPDTADLSSVPEADVLHDRDTAGQLVTLGLPSAAAAAAAGLARATTVGRTRFWVCPPGTAWDGASAHTVDVEVDPFAWSPGLVRGCVDVTPDDWARVLGADRWGIVLELASGGGRPYRCAMLAAAPHGLTVGSPGLGPRAMLDDFERPDADPLDGNWAPPLGRQPARLAGGRMVPAVKNEDVAEVWGSLLGPDAELWVELAVFVPSLDPSDAGDATIRLRRDGTGNGDVLFSFDTTGFGWAFSQVGGVAEFNDQRNDYAFQEGDLVGLRVVGPQAEVLLDRGGAVTVLASWTTATVAGDVDSEIELGMFDASGESVFAPQDAPIQIASVRAAVPASVPHVAADALPAADDWDLRFFHDEGEFEYPVCVVKSVGAPTLVSNQNWYELTQAYAVYAYPTPPPSATGTASEAHVAAERVRQLLVDAFAAARADGARPMRIPLYDYEGLASNLPASHREPADYMRVAGASVDLQPEPNDPRQTVVVADLRLNWRVPVGEAPGRGIVRSVELTTTET